MVVTQTETLPALLTVEQFAEQCSIGRTLAYQLVSRGDVRSLTIGRARRIPATEVQTFIQRQLEAQGT